MAGSPAGDLRLTPEVWAALRDGRPVVALESSVFAQGLPVPANAEAAARMLAAISKHGATAAITAVAEGNPTLGLSQPELERFLLRDGIKKVSTRDLGITISRGLNGATTVAASLAIVARSDVAVFATGGIGGVHRGAPYDESADLIELSRTPRIVVCAGAKSILDLRATVERLETLSVPVVGFRTDEFPAFYSARSGLAVSVTATSVKEIVSIERAHRSLGRREAILVVQPPPAEAALGSDEVEAALKKALVAAEAEGIAGPATTPFLLAALERETGGRTLRANLALLEANAELAAEIASAIN